MNEVYAVTLVYILKQRAFFSRKSQCVPADLRYFERYGQIIGNGFYIAGNKTETLILAVLKAFVKQKLHTEADTEQRLSLFGFGADYFTEAALFKQSGGIAKRPYAGQHYFVGVTQLISGTRHCNIRADKLKRAAQ